MLQAARKAARIAACSKWFAWVATPARLNATGRDSRIAWPAAVMVGDGHQYGVRHKAKQQDRSCKRPRFACSRI